MLNAMQSRESPSTWHMASNSNASIQSLSATAEPSSSSISARRAGHARSASILSSSSSVSIPSRSSSVMRSPAAVPTRISSIASPSQDDRPATRSAAALPLTTSDLANTLSSLTLVDHSVRKALDPSNHATLPVDLDSSRDELNIQTPQPRSAPFAPSFDVSGHSMPLAHNIAPSTPSPELSLRKMDLVEISEEINDAHDAIELIQAHIFSIQEQRHGSKTCLVHQHEQSSRAPPLALEARQSDSSSLAGVDLSLMQLDEKVESLSRVMQQLEVRIAEIRDPATDGIDLDAGDASIIDKEMTSWQARARSSSVASIDSWGTLDDMAFPGFTPALTPEAIRTKHDNLCSAWTALQHEVDALKKELADDKYLDVFHSMSSQAEGMMDSLDKAVSLCHIFVQQVQRDHLAGRLHKAAAVEDDLEGDYDIGAKHDELVALTKTFGVKKSYYLPACQQVFHSLEKGCRERQTANGTILRRLSDLRSRWRNLRDELTKTERDLKRMEILFSRVRSDSSGSSMTYDVASPATSAASLPPLPTKLRTSASMQLGLGLGTPTRASTSSHRTTPSSSSSSRITSGPSRLSSSSSVSSHLSNLVPAADTPPPRLRHISATAESLGMPSKMVSTPSRVSASKQLEPSRASQRAGLAKSGRFAVSQSGEVTDTHDRATTIASTSTRVVEKGNFGRSPATRPISMIGGRSAAVDYGMSGTPSRAPPSSFKSSWHELENSGASRARPAQPKSMPRSQSQVVWPSRSDASTTEPDKDDSIEYLKFGSGSSPARPSSSAGQYYRPPSAQGKVGDAKTRKRESMIPRLSLRGSDAQSSPSRPGSALSQSSMSTPMRYTGASRLSMQTPEPAIVARAQRLSMYARAPSTGFSGVGGSDAHTPSKRASKPPPVRRNVALSSGRATPLSAAALASLPSAEPGASLKRSSIANLRSLQNGRTTPTFSDNGSVGGKSSATWYGPGRGVRGVSGAGSRIGSGSVAGSNYGGTAAIEQYRANPNDTLDVEVAAICNGLGVALERIDAPLPRGVRLEEGPGKDNRAQYEIGGLSVMCRLLELHRPAGSAGARAGTKTKKILVRVGGGWQDLEQWLLGRLSST